MSQRELLIVLAHAQFCDPCRWRLLTDPAAVSVGRALNDTEKETLAHLTADDFLTPSLLARAVGATAGEIEAYRDHPVARLRHF
jgi:hypothetical protein